MPLNGKTFPYVPPAASTQQQISSLNKIIDLLNSLNRLQIITDDTTNRVIIGKYNDFSGIKVSKPGVDVKTASDADLYFNSNQNTFKVVKTGEFILAHVASTELTEASISHGLGYTPAYLAYVSDNYSSGVPVYELLPRVLVLTDGSIGEQIKTYVDSTSVRVSLLTPSSTPNPNPQYQNGFERRIKYYLLQESAS